MPTTAAEELRRGRPSRTSSRGILLLHREITTLALLTRKELMMLQVIQPLTSAPYARVYAALIILLNLDRTLLQSKRKVEFCKPQMEITKE